MLPCPSPVISLSVKSRTAIRRPANLAVQDLDVGKKNLGTLGIYFQWEDMVIIGDLSWDLLRFERENTGTSSINGAFIETYSAATTTAAATTTTTPAAAATTTTTTKTLTLTTATTTTTTIPIPSSPSQPAYSMDRLPILSVAGGWKSPVFWHP